MFSDDEKRYVTPEEGRKQFPTGVALWVYCAQCGAPLLVPEGGTPFCNGRDASACSNKTSRYN